MKRPSLIDFGYPVFRISYKTVAFCQFRRFFTYCRLSSFLSGLIFVVSSIVVSSICSIVD